MQFAMPYRMWKLDGAALAVLMRVFYGLMAYVSANQFLPLIMRNPFSSSDWLWPVGWLHFVPLPGAMLILGMGALGFAAASSVFIYNRTVKFLAVLFFFLAAAAYESQGVFSFALIALLQSGFMLAFIRKDSDGNGFYFFCAQLAFLCTYTYSGIWKIRGLIEAGLHGQWPLIDPVTYLMSSYKLQFLDFSGPIWSPAPALGYALWAGVIALETLSALAAFYPRVQRTWGLMLFLMHAVPIALLDLHYWQHMLLAIILMIANPYRTTISE